ncbi:MAG: hypothetical protein MHPSP_003148 [Paramarteilia canceri]
MLSTSSYKYSEFSSQNQEYSREIEHSSLASKSEGEIESMKASGNCSFCGTQLQKGSNVYNLEVSEQKHSNKSNENERIVDNSIKKTAEIKKRSENKQMDQRM